MLRHKGAQCLFFVYLLLIKFRLRKCDRSTFLCFGCKGKVAKERARPTSIKGAGFYLAYAGEMEPIYPYHPRQSLSDNPVPFLAAPPF